MTIKKFYVYRMVIAALLAAVMSISITINNYLLAIVSVITAVLIILMLKRNVSEVIADERDYELAGKSARYSMAIFAVMATIITFVLLLFRETNPLYETAASILAYSICGLMIINSIIFKYLRSDTTNKKTQIYWMVIFIILGLILIIFNLRFFSGEDDWMCQNGEWIKHGQPDHPMPTTPCQK